MKTTVESVKLVNESIDNLDKNSFELEHLIQMLENSMDAVIMIDVAGRIIFFNQTAEKLFQHHRNEVYGKNISLLMPRKHSVQHNQYIANYLNGGDSKIIGKGRELEAIRKDGTSFPIMLNVVDTFGKNGRYFTAFIEDLQHQKHLEHQNLYQIQLDKKLSDFDVLLKENMHKSLEELTNIMIDYISEHAQACVGMLYIKDMNNHAFETKAVYGHSIRAITYQNNDLGVGMVGQVIASSKPIYLSDIPTHQVLLSISNFKLSIKAIYILPILFNEQVYGAIELHFLKNPTEEILIFLKKAIRNLSILIENVNKYNQIQDLLDKSELQRNELELSQLKLSQNIEDLSIAQELLSKQAQKTDEAYSLLKENYAKLMQSIQYAKQIQTAFLPQDSMLQKGFSEHFVLYQPKDTVSGDFYWYYTYKNMQIIAVGDCTGHGVPGAFMSLLAMNLLSQAIADRKLFYPEIILEFLREQVKVYLQKDGRQLNDGMDISLCCIEKKNKYAYDLSYAGAKSFMFYSQSGQLLELKGDRSTIGGFYAKQSPFTSQNIRLQMNERIYFFTDGITDICNHKRNSYGKARLHQFLKKNMYLPMDLQKSMLKKEIADYQGVQDQRDDITVLGFKLCHI